MKLKRSLYGPHSNIGPSHGGDVYAVKRGLWQYGHDLFDHPKRSDFDDVYNEKTVIAVDKLRKIQKREQGGPFRQDDLDAIYPHMDKYGRFRYWKYQPPKPVSPQDLIFEKLVASMKELSAHTPGYLLGGGHGIALSRVSPYQKLDCSSSCSKVLYDAGIFPDDIAWVSGTIAYKWGVPGTGRYFTVYANAEHVWIRLYKTKWWRFDTSPHGDGGRGPKLRMLPRFSSTFVARHWPGM